MSKLPVFSTIGQGMAVFGLYFGRLFLWLLIPLLLGGAALGATLGLAAWKDAIGHGWSWWLLPVAPAVLFAFQVGLPYAIRINQLAVMGRVEPTGYLKMIFSPRGFRYLGYCCAVSLIFIVGLALAATPGLMSSYLSDRESLELVKVLGVLASLVMGMVFFVLTSPLNLVFPAVAVERDPSLGRAYNLGADCKWRLFWCVALSSLFFVVLSACLDGLGNMFKSSGGGVTEFVLMPLRVLLGVFSYVTSVAVPAVAYRILSGLPDPRFSEGTAGAAGMPGPADPAGGAGPSPGSGFSSMVVQPGSSPGLEAVLDRPASSETTGLAGIIDKPASPGSPSSSGLASVVIPPTPGKGPQTQAGSGTPAADALPSNGTAREKPEDQTGLSGDSNTSGDPDKSGPS